MRIIDLVADPSAGIPRPPAPDAPEEAVRAIIKQVVDHGDQALIELTERFDRVRLDSLRVSQEEIDEAYDSVKPELIEAMTEAARRIRIFATHQSLQPWEAEVGGGIIGEVVYPVSRAGCYVPGGKAAYPSTVLKTPIPRVWRGCPRSLCACPRPPTGPCPQPPWRQRGSRE